MIKSFLAKNVRNFNEFNINFSINKSKRNGKLTNDDDFFKTKNDKILKMIGITGANGSGKTTLLELFKLYEIWTRYHSFLTIAQQKANNFFSNQAIQNAQKENPIQGTVILNPNKWLNTREHIDKIYEEFDLLFKAHFNTNCFTINEPIIYQVNYINSKNEELEHYIEINREGSIISRLNNISKNNLIVEQTFDYSLDKNNIMNLIPNPKFEIFYANINTIFVGISSLFDTNPISIENFIIPSTTLNHPYKAYRDEVNNQIYEYLKINEENRIKFIEWLRLADPSITGISPNHSQRAINFFIKQNGEGVTLDRLSKGTLKWIYFFYILQINNFDYSKDHSGSDRIIFIDEIENYLHDKLIKTILRIISQSNERIQLIFTTHNTYLFEDTFRHQGVYLIENNHDKSLNASHNLISLSEYNIKKDKKIFKLFLDEKISSHPDGISILDWIEKYYGSN